jgi:hypothetical protein
LVKAEQASNLYTNEDDICVKYYTRKTDKAWSGKHTLSLYGALASDEASILVPARTEHCGLNACLSRKKLANSPACECGRGDETVLHVLLPCGWYAEARKALREAAGDRWVEWGGDLRERTNLRAQSQKSRRPPYMRTPERNRDLHLYWNVLLPLAVGEILFACAPSRSLKRTAPRRVQSRTLI